MSNGRPVSVSNGTTYCMYSFSVPVVTEPHIRQAGNELLRPLFPCVIRRQRGASCSGLRCKNIAVMKTDCTSRQRLATPQWSQETQLTYTEG